MQFGDNSEHYGTISRSLHWTMALLLLWQLLTALAHFFFDDTAIKDFFWPTHKPLGLLLIILIVLRAGWAITNLNRRPPSVSVPAKLGHIALYLLLFAVPALALLRQYGSARPFEPFGITLMSGFEGGKIEWMVQPGNILHGWLGWCLFALIFGHIIMAFWHRKSAQDEDVIPRMWR